MSFDFAYSAVVFALQSLFICNVSKLSIFILLLLDIDSWLETSFPLPGNRNLLTSYFSTSVMSSLPFFFPFFLHSSFLPFFLTFFFPFLSFIHLSICLSIIYHPSSHLHIYRYNLFEVYPIVCCIDPMIILPINHSVSQYHLFIFLYFLPIWDIIFVT